MHSDEYPCPCPVCDMPSIMENEFCAKCSHENCSVKHPKCPDAQRSHDWCDYCHMEKETVSAHPEENKNRICGDCHPEGSLPDEDEWWETETENQDECPRCGNEFGLSSTASCTDCGYIPEENQA